MLVSMLDHFPWAVSPEESFNLLPGMSISLVTSFQRDKKMRSLVGKGTEVSSFSTGNFHSSSLFLV